VGGRIRIPDTVLVAIWTVSSVCVLLAYGFAWALLVRISRRFPTIRINELEVVVSDKFGPATFGFLRPRIIAPEWILGLPPEQRDCMLQHEREHIAGKDQLLSFAALALTATMPWNPALWWQMRRLRAAMEIDCDARVLRGHADPLTYSRALLAVGERHSIAPLAAIALTDPVSRLERRVALLLKPMPPNRKVAAGCSLAALTMVAGACAMEAPRSISPSNPAAALLAAGAVQAGEIDRTIPEGWARMTGGGPDDVPNICDLGTDPAFAERGVSAMTVRCPMALTLVTFGDANTFTFTADGAPQAGFGGLHQSIPAEPWIGKRVRFTAFLKSEGIQDGSAPEAMMGLSGIVTSNDPRRRTTEGSVQGLGGLWLRAGAGVATLAVDNMRDRAVTGTTEWRQLETVLDVPDGALSVSMGFWMQGQGQIWLANPTFEEVGRDVPVTGGPPEPVSGPVNLELSL
jgi:hypothetical protein